MVVNNSWLVVSNPLNNISQLGWLFPIYGKIKNVPNHQPDSINKNKQRNQSTYQINPNHSVYPPAHLQKLHPAWFSLYVAKLWKAPRQYSSTDKSCLGLGSYDPATRANLGSNRTSFNQLVWPAKMVIEWDVIRHQLEYQRNLVLQPLNVLRHQWVFFAASGNSHHFQHRAMWTPQANHAAMIIHRA
jgi:hypothetical protein